MIILLKRTTDLSEAFLRTGRGNWTTIALPKAFDCLPHGLVVDKLVAYDLSNSARSLLQRTLSDGKQMVKLGHCKSTFLKIIKGAPQVSILGPLLFNIFLNDIFYFVKKIKPI